MNGDTQRGWTGATTAGVGDRWECEERMRGPFFEEVGGHEWGLPVSTTGQE